MLMSSASVGQVVADLQKRARPLDGGLQGMLSGYYPSLVAPQCDFCHRQNNPLTLQFDSERWRHGSSWQRDMGQASSPDSGVDDNPFDVILPGRD